MRHLVCRSAMLTLVGGLCLTAAAVAADVATGGADSTGIGLGVGGTAMAIAGWRIVAALETIAAKGIHHHHELEIRGMGDRLSLRLDTEELDEPKPDRTARRRQS
jgi:hypothetical protein